MIDQYTGYFKNYVCIFNSIYLDWGKSEFMIQNIQNKLDFFIS